ncbi:hypothetical protein E1281_24410 [Actinomadura sp. KC345]|uniref:hypothetical protein n=1 Tax=Actinomadura sp. KC345 TaxID=2530371 RepID=UPI00104F5DF5|nr:hypothetical protein [Actinomadura sp. KC345]TDC48686.1 hypothetical protein E1281_24410 [Actinomadura sp. KC345]
MTDEAIFAISLGVTLLGLVISWGVYRRRGAGTGLRGAALSLVPLAAAMTGVTEFFVDLAFSPVKWAGVAVAGLAVVLYMASGAMMSRRAASGGGGGGTQAAEGGRRKPAGRSGKKKDAVEGPAPGGDPEMAEIEKILRDRGIS